MKTNCIKKQGWGGGTKHWALMKLKSWNSLSSSLVLHAKVASNRCVRVTLTIIISLRSCYNWQQLCGVVRRLARQRKGGGGSSGGGLTGWWVQRQQCESDEGERGRGRGLGAYFNLGHLPVCTGLGDRATPPSKDTCVALCIHLN